MCDVVASDLGVVFNSRKFLKDLYASDLLCAQHLTTEIKIIKAVNYRCEQTRISSLKKNQDAR